MDRRNFLASAGVIASPFSTLRSDRRNQEGYFLKAIQDEVKSRPDCAGPYRVVQWLSRVVVLVLKEEGCTEAFFDLAYMESMEARAYAHMIIQKAKNSKLYRFATVEFLDGEYLLYPLSNAGYRIDGVSGYETCEVKDLTCTDVTS
jgi:hypothetical protein